jgi:hypothetical protein
LASPPPIQPNAKNVKVTANTTNAAPTCESTSCGFMPLHVASAKKPPTRISETRFEMVIVKRSLEAANAIIAGKSRIAGNSRSRAASVVSMNSSFATPEKPRGY